MQVVRNEIQTLPERLFFHKTGYFTGVIVEEMEDGMVLIKLTSMARSHMQSRSEKLKNDKKLGWHYMPGDLRSIRKCESKETGKYLEA